MAVPLGFAVVEVAIIGAGPAGSTLAALLAARGIDVTLFDRDPFPRDKLCGEFLSYDALPVLDALGVDLAHAPHIETCRIIGAKRTYAFALPKPARGVSRLFLDDLLLRTAERNGAKRRDGETVSELPKAKVIVGAWGRWGRFDRQLARSFVNVKDRNFGFKRHYVQPEPRTSIDLYSFRNGYLGVNAVEGNVTNICGLVHASRLAGHKGRWDAFIDTIRAEEPHLDALYAAHAPAQEGYLSSEPVIFRARSAVEGGVFMIGDASGVLDPLTGNGMAMAIQSALLAAPYVVGALETPLHRTQIENDYRDAHRRFFAPRITWSRRAALLLSRPRLLDAALTAIRTPRAGELFLHRTRAGVGEVERLAAAWFR
ncbi:MAG TPA: NAD(P)/FAD-dependent oxidoreductase [Thermoanaerobaculia bacterium]|nr:NAD(P)/FAD-dependent oxidoreductase [Thermoanaerobaculia bacterium]